MSKRRKPAARNASTAAVPAPAAPAAAKAPVDVADAPTPDPVTSGRVLGLLCVQVSALLVGLRVLPTLTAGVRLNLDLLSLLSPLIEAPLPTILGTIVVMFPTQLFVGAQLRRWQSNGAKVALETAPLLNALLGTLLASLALHCLAVLLGAPFFHKWQHTLALATLVAVLAFTPAGYVLDRSDQSTWIRLFSTLEATNTTEKTLRASYVGALFGCWVGAAGIPLDWDRPWQVWPITCVIGTLAGHQIASWGSLAVSDALAAGRA